MDTQDRQEPFVTRLCEELTALAPFAEPLDTIFVGGGTPTLLRPDLWTRLLTHLHRTFDVSAAPEFTVECNPETATPALFEILVRGGVNRVSVGAQSFDPRHLKTLERWHDPANVIKAITLAREAGIARQSLDLIYGVPGQTLDELRIDLAAALSVGTTHLSCYSLTYEPGTAMTARLTRGEFIRTDEDIDADMFCLTLDTLRAAGLERYEVSNFAVPGDECRHNLAYWRQSSWLAAGPSASGHLAGARWKNLPRLDDYLRFSDHGFAAAMDIEQADPGRNTAERIMTGLRTTEGLDSAALMISAGAAAHRLPAIAARMRQRGHLKPRENRWQLTDAGFLFADSIAAEFMHAITTAQ